MIKVLLYMFLIPIIILVLVFNYVTDLFRPNTAKDYHNHIRIGIIGPMTYMSGKNIWLGAQIAADEINAHGGVKVGADAYGIELISSGSNEMSSITDATAAMERLIAIDRPDFVAGGFETEAVAAMREIAMDHHIIFMGCGADGTSLNSVVKSDYDRYKYWFRVSPFASDRLVDNTIMELAEAKAIIKEETGIERKLRVAICAEDDQRADDIIETMNGYIPSKLDMEVSDIWRPSSMATDCDDILMEIQATNTDIICPIIYGPTGIPYARSWDKLKVPAASVGINIESQQTAFFLVTHANYETSLNTYTKGIQISPITKPFVDTFEKKMKGYLPMWCAGTYDAIYFVAHAVARAGTLNSDAVVAELEKTREPSTAAPLFTFMGMDTASPHDVTYGPGACTGIATQWQNGEMVAVWPNPAYAESYVAAGYPAFWKEVNYQGVVKWQAPPRLIDKLKAEVASSN